MDILASTITNFMSDYLLPFMRISGLFASMVGFSAKTIPTPIRSLLAVLLTLMIVPVIPPVPVTDLVNLGTFVLGIKHCYWLHIHDGIEHFCINRPNYCNADGSWFCVHRRPCKWH